jgi:hypothetical protein
VRSSLALDFFWLGNGSCAGFRLGLEIPFIHSFIWQRASERANERKVMLLMLGDREIV